jgi:hypothetical protein
MATRQAKPSKIQVARRRRAARRGEAYVVDYDFPGQIAERVRRRERFVCDAAFGEYLHHTPDEAMEMSMAEALAETVRAWDRSGQGAERESVLWDLDRRLGIEQPFAGLSAVELSAARSASPYPLTNGWVAAPTHVGTYAAGSCGGGCGGS